MRYGGATYEILHRLKLSAFIS
uniref:Uncharacterized protein n=1 Tax=Rhizophora mucronata TaxID=61149 RepID=A0A2P2PGA0_RHIMU